ncbi:MAG TPA: hypothetical protein VMG08_02650 [Allosphingosinicella sp.]|nr:hypothetical protein [Allosphingosinicella sp.]
MQRILTGTITSGFQFASGEAVGRAENPSPFRAGTLRTQQPYLAALRIDLERLVPGLRWGTINLRLGEELVLGRADHVAEALDWTREETGAGRIPPETFSFVHCCFVYARGGAGGCAYHPGLIYYPHPETKPTTNAHRYDVLEILTTPVAGLKTGAEASLVCRADAFRPR